MARAHPPSALAAIYDRHLPGWRHEPEILVRADRLPEDVVWSAHREAKRRLLQRVADASGVAMDLELPLVGFARRTTGYKRLDLTFTNLQRLRAMSRRYPLQIVVAGKAHPRDGSGKDMIERIHGCIRCAAAGASLGRPRRRRCAPSRRPIVVKRLAVADQSRGNSPWAPEMLPHGMATRQHGAPAWCPAAALRLPSSGRKR